MKFKYPKRNRLLVKSQFDCVFEKGFRKNSVNWTFFVRKNPEENSRLGIVITKRNYKKAVSRNRIKRIIRESFRNNQYEVGNLDVIVMVKKGIDQKSIRKDLDAQWKTLKHCLKSR